MLARPDPDAMLIDDPEVALERFRFEEWKELLQQSRKRRGTRNLRSKDDDTRALFGGMTANVGEVLVERQQRTTFSTGLVGELLVR